MTGAKREPDRLVSGIGGTGAGTALAGAGIGFGPETTVGKILFLLSPVTSVAASGCFYYGQMRVQRWAEGREADQAKALLNAALADPNVSDEDKEDFKKLLSGYYRDRVERQLRRVRGVGESSEPDAPGGDEGGGGAAGSGVTQKTGGQ